MYNLAILGLQCNLKNNYFNTYNYTQYNQACTWNILSNILTDIMYYPYRCINVLKVCIHRRLSLMWIPCNARSYSACTHVSQHLKQSILAYLFYLCLKNSCLRIQTFATPCIQIRLHLIKRNITLLDTEAEKLVLKNQQQYSAFSKVNTLTEALNGHHVTCKIQSLVHIKFV